MICSFANSRQELVQNTQNVKGGNREYGKSQRKGIAKQYSVGGVHMTKSSPQHVEAQQESDSGMSGAGGIPGLVSVIMAAYNCEAYVGEAVASVLAQTFQYWVLIVVDDASTDRTAETVEEFADKDARIRLLQNERNVGPVASRNRAIATAQGEFVAILDNDDVALPERLTLSVAALREKPDLGLVGGTSWSIDEEGTIAGHPHPKKPRDDAGAHRRVVEQCSMPFVHSSYMIRVSVLRQLNGYDEFFRYASDLDLILRVSACSRIGFVPEPLVMVRHRAGQMTTRHTYKVQALARTAQAQFRAKQKGIEFNREAELERQLAQAKRDLGPLDYGPLRDHYKAGKMYLAGGKIEKARREFAHILRELPWSWKTRARWLYAIMLLLKQRAAGWLRILMTGIARRG